MTSRVRVLLFAGSALAMSLCGCVPFVDDVLRPEGPLLKSNEYGNCSIGGADLTHVTLEAKTRIDFSPVDVRKGTGITFDVFVPRNVSARFDGRQVSLETVRGKILENMEYLQGRLAAPIDGPDSSLILVGDSNEGASGRAYSFKIRLDSTPVEEFVMTLPAMHIGEHPVDPIVIHYRRRHLLGVTGVACN